MSDDRKYLDNVKDVMLAFLNDDRLQNSNYFGCGHYLYLGENGDICEEDGAGAKANRLPFSMRNGERWWIYG